MPLRALREGERMMAAVRTRLKDLHCPLLMMHAREDEITRLESVQRLFDALPTRDKQLAVLENSYHMVTIDNDRQEVASLITQFVKRLAPPQMVDAVPPERPIADARPRSVHMPAIAPDTIFIN